LNQVPQLRLLYASLAYIALLVAFWSTAAFFGVERMIGGHFSSAFVSFALLLAPFWFFGFSMAAQLRSILHTPLRRILAASCFIIPYLVYALPRGEFRWGIAFAILIISVGLTALFEFSRDTADQQPGWRDLMALGVLGITVNQRLLAGAWAHPGLGGMAKLLLTDIGLYLYLVIRQLEGVGYSFIPEWDDVKIGLREWAYFAPIAVVIGLALGFLHFHPQLPSPLMFPAAWLSTLCWLRSLKSCFSVA